MDIPVYIKEKIYKHGKLYVHMSDGQVKVYDGVELGCVWLQMSNDAFYNVYGFNFNPHEYGLYNICRRKVYGR